MITLIPPSRRSVTRAVLHAPAVPAQWAYLGASIRTREAVARWLGSGPQQIALSDLLQGTARSFRTAYIEYIGRLGVESDSPDWWFSSLSEKSPTMSKAFLHICYAAAAAELCLRHKDAETLMLVVEDREVRRAIGAYLQESGARFTEVREPCASRLAGSARDWAEMLARRAYWIGRQAARMAVARVLGYSAGVMNGASEACPWVLLHNWVDAKSFPAEGGYRDAYFGRLREELQKRGLSVAVVATVLSRSPYRRILEWLKRSGMPVLVPEAALTLLALLRWIGSLPIRPPRRRAWPRFQGFDVSDILAGVERMDWINPRAAAVRVIPEIVAQWRRRVDARAFIYTYEGQTWERGYCRAMRAHFPQAGLIGYQHATVSPMWLSHFISLTEWDEIHFPDRLVTNGRHPYKLLQQSGVPERALACGGAFRYDALLGVSPAPDRETSGSPVTRVLVTPPILLAQAAELLLAALRAFADPQKFQVTLKFHPHLPTGRVLREAGVGSFPAHVRVAKEPVADLLRDSDVLVYTYSAAALEALAYGVPVVHFASGCEIDLDPLASFEGIRVSAGTAEGLREAVRAVVQVGGEEHDARVRRWREIVGLLLSPVDGKTIDLFMPEGLRKESDGAGHVTTNVR